MTDEHLLTVVNNERVHLRAELPERELRRVRLGAAARVTVDAVGDTPIEGRVTEILPAANQGNLTFTVKISVPNREGRLKHGMFGRARTQIETERRHDVVVIPRHAVVEQVAGTLAFIVKDGKAAAVPVRLGVTVGDRVEVLSGLEEGERLIVRGQGNLQGGEPVAVRPGA